MQTELTVEDAVDGDSCSVECFRLGGGRDAPASVVRRSCVGKRSGELHSLHCRRHSGLGVAGMEGLPGVRHSSIHMRASGLLKAVHAPTQVRWVPAHRSAPRQGLAELDLCANMAADVAARAGPGPAGLWDCT